MSVLSRFRIHRQVAAGASVEVSEKNGVRYLHLGSDTIQSAMRRTRPNDLELSYTRCMMAYLLFVPPPATILMIGLGGGSLAKFVYHRMPETRVTSVEINPQVVAAATQLFELPHDPVRLTVEVADGAEYVRDRSPSADVVMIDAYGTEEAAPGLATAAFYADCRRALSDNGVLVTNLFTRERGLDAHLRRLAGVFDGRVLRLTDEPRGNLIALAFARDQGQPSWKTLAQRARRLAALYGLEFPTFARALKVMNDHDSQRLHI